MGYAAAPRVAFIVYGIQTFFQHTCLSTNGAAKCDNNNMVYKTINSIKTASPQMALGNVTIMIWSKNQ